MENDDIYCVFSVFFVSFRYFIWLLLQQPISRGRWGRGLLLLLLFFPPFCRRFLLLLLLARPRRVPFNLAEILASPTKGNVHRYTRQVSFLLSLSFPIWFVSPLAPPFCSSTTTTTTERLFILFFCGKYHRRNYYYWRPPRVPS